MNNQMDPDNGVNSTGTLDGEGVAPGRLGVIRLQQVVIQLRINNHMLDGVSEMLFP